MFWAESLDYFEQCFQGCKPRGSSLKFVDLRVLAISRGGLFLDLSPSHSAKLVKPAFILRIAKETLLNPLELAIGLIRELVLVGKQRASLITNQPNFTGLTPWSKADLLGAEWNSVEPESLISFGHVRRVSPIL